jgi:DnaJ-domain-containing protein 1
VLLPGRLEKTTLGDLLGVVHRAGATGTLELVEDRGRAHRIHVAQGLVVSVEIDGVAPSLAEILRRDRAIDDDVLRRSLLRAMASQRLHGEVLVHEFHLSPSVVGNALRRQILARLAMLERLPGARISFRVALRVPRGSLHDLPLQPSEFLHGRRRTRERAAASPQPARVRDTTHWRVLGLSPGASETEIKRAYRRLARSVHPDLHPGASPEERRALEVQFSEITSAYRALVA